MGASTSARVEDVPVVEVWSRLKGESDTVLIDVRTRSEWAFVGLPDLSSLGKRVLTVEWQSFPDNRIDPAFAQRLSELLAASGASKDSELFFICRSGSRSRAAAEAMVAAGFARCRNAAEGFEGPLDATRHRGTVCGWKAAGLPWVQG